MSDIKVRQGRILRFQKNQIERLYSKENKSNKVSKPKNKL